VVQSLDGRGEQPMTSFNKFLLSGARGGWRSALMIPSDWSLDDQRLLVGSDQFTAPHYSLYWLSLAAAPQAERAPRRPARLVGPGVSFGDVFPLTGRRAATGNHRDCRRAAVLSVHRHEGDPSTVR
jgi:hypothetical protein